MRFWDHGHVRCPALPNLLLMEQDSQAVAPSTSLTLSREAGFPLFPQRGFVLSSSSIHLCSVCAGACLPLLHPLPPSKVSQCPCCCLGGVSDPPPPSPPGWVQGPDFHFNSRLSAEASPPPRPANKEPTVRGWDVQPALTSPPSSMGLFSPSAEARGAGLVGGRLLSLGNMPLILSSPSLSPLRALWSIRGLFDSQLVFVWC